MRPVAPDRAAVPQEPLANVLLGRADQVARQDARLEPAKVRHGLLYHPPAKRTLRTSRQVQCTLPSFLRILWCRCMRDLNHLRPKKEIGWVGTTRSNRPCALTQPIDPTRTALRELAKTTLQLLRLG